MASGVQAFVQRVTWDHHPTLKAQQVFFMEKPWKNHRTMMENGFKWGYHEPDMGSFTDF